MRANKGRSMARTDATVLHNGMQFDSLTSLQIGILRNIGKGSFSEFDASENTLDIVYGLQSSKFVTGTFELDISGTEALGLVAKYGGGYQRRRAAAMVYEDDEITEFSTEWDVHDIAANPDRIPLESISQY